MQVKDADVRIKETYSIADAAEVMGLRLPVRVELHTELPGGSKAGYIGVVGGTHRIRIRVGKQKLPKVGTWVALGGTGSESLWHELTHAWQCERDFGGSSKAAFEFYAEDIKKRLKEVGVELRPEDFGHLGMRITEEREVSKRMFGRSISPTWDAYEASPWEVEARSMAASLGSITLKFPVSAKTRRDANIT